MTHLILPCVLACVAHACASPISPRMEIHVDGGLHEAYEMAQLPLVTSTITAVKWVRLDGVSAQFRRSSREIEINSQLKGSDSRVLAGLIVHEWSHAQGMNHDCDDGIRDRDNNGAWEAHARTLDRLGVAHEIRQFQFCWGE